MKARDLKGLKFNSLYVEYLEKQIGSKRYWFCTCDCGNKIVVLQSSILHKTHPKYSCGCLKRGNKSKNFAGCGELSLRYWNSIRYFADKRNIEFNITIDYAWELFVKQNKKCAISNIPIQFCIFSKNNKEKYSSKSASLDRIDSLKGYVEGNVHWVHKNINKMKQEFDIKYFIDTCKLIAEYNKDK